MRLSVVVPCFNEEDSVEPLHDAITASLAGAGLDDIEIIYVDDGSRDGTLAVLRRLACRHSAVKYTSFSRNFGKEAAMLAGLQRSEGDAVVILDADLQHPPELIPRMVDLYRQGYDQVVAQRDRREDGMARKVTARLFYRAANRLIDVRLHDGAGDFRLLSRRAVDAVLTMPEYNRFSKGLFSWIGFTSVAIPLADGKRHAGSSKWTFGKLLNYAFDGLLSFNNKPLRLAVYGGLLLTLFALGYAVWVVANAVLNGVDMPGYTTIIVAVAGMGGFQMMILGMIGEYIGRIYYETKRRPHFLSMETEGNITRSTENTANSRLTGGNN